MTIKDAARHSANALNNGDWFSAKPVTELELEYYLEMLKSSVDAWFSNHPDGGASGQVAAQTRGVAVLGTRSGDAIYYEYFIHVGNDRRELE